MCQLMLIVLDDCVYGEQVRPTLHRNLKLPENAISTCTSRESIEQAEGATLKPPLEGLICTGSIVMAKQISAIQILLYFY